MATLQAVPNITPDLPAFPGPNTPEAAYDDTAYNWGSAIPGYGGRIKAIGDNVYNNAQHAAEQSDAAKQARDRAETASANALSAMNFKGDWNTLSGALSRPATVQHAGSVWLLMRDVANVAAEVPGTSTAWLNQSAKVSSVMGRTGDVTGLVNAVATWRNKTFLMADAPVGQPTIYYDAAGGAADWPVVAYTTAWVVETSGDSTLKIQRATQTAPETPYSFERFYTAGAWSGWQRILTDRGEISRHFRTDANSATTPLSLVNGAYQTVLLFQNTSIVLPSPRTVGDQLLLRISPAVAGASFAFSGAAMKPPVGVTLPAISTWQILTLTLIGTYDASGWHAFVSGVHQ